MDEHRKKKNTPKAYKQKQDEFRDNCDFFYQLQPEELRYTVTKDRVEFFMTYCLYSEQKPHGKRKRGGGSTVLLDYGKANQILKTHAAARRHATTGEVTEETKNPYTALQPRNGVC